jgi:hypothetical protein
MIVILAVFFKLKRFEFNYSGDTTMDYNEVLLIIGLGAIYLFELYSIIAVLNKDKRSHFIWVTVPFMNILEGTMQSILIIDCLKKYTEDKELKRIKPARSLITALILIDVSLWLVDTFSGKKYDMNTVELEYYNIVFWSIVSVFLFINIRRIILNNFIILKN